MRFFLVDKVTKLTVGERATGIKNITLSDDVLHDHFPSYPIMPGVLILEGAAQLAGFLLETGADPLPDGTVPRALLVQIEKAKFRAGVGPGDQLEIRVEVTSRLAGAAQVRAAIDCAGRQVARADLTFALKRIDYPEIHEQRRRLYRLWTRDLELEVPIR